VRVTLTPKNGYDGGAVLDCKAPSLISPRFDRRTLSFSSPAPTTLRLAFTGGSAASGTVYVLAYDENGRLVENRPLRGDFADSPPSPYTWDRLKLRLDPELPPYENMENVTVEPPNNEAPRLVVAAETPSAVNTWKSDIEPSIYLLRATKHDDILVFPSTKSPLNVGWTDKEIQILRVLLTPEDHSKLEWWGEGTPSNEDMEKIYDEWKHWRGWQVKFRLDTGKEAGPFTQATVPHLSSGSYASTPLHMGLRFEGQKVVLDPAKATLEGITVPSGWKKDSYRIEGYLWEEYVESTLLPDLFEVAELPNNFSTVIAYLFGQPITFEKDGKNYCIKVHGNRRTYHLQVIGEAAYNGDRVTGPDCFVTIYVNDFTEE
jgi:hypothetical protein